LSARILNLYPPSSILMKLLLLTALLLIPTLALAQDVQFLSATQQSDAVVAAAQDGLAVSVLGDRGGYLYIIVRRDESGEVEVHERWDDVFVIQEGSGIVIHGGTHAGGRTTAPGEVRGGEITGGMSRRVAAGDVMVIPAGLPHQVTVDEGGSITYFVVKASSGK
jgi:mannose-6-phosphate isomerase-like protein (cupin superfamily)